MVVGVPKEIKPGENRVALLPSGVAAFVSHGHEVLVEKGAGLGSGLSDALYREAGARIVRTAASMWQKAEFIVKVKEPADHELERMQPGQVIYAFLHLASTETLTRTMLERRVTGIAYETVQLDDGSLPLLAPMSEVAGRLAVQEGAHCLEASSKGRGVLLSGTSGVEPGRVVVLGAGVAGSNACRMAAALGAHVTVLDINPAKLRYLYDIMGGRVTTAISNEANIAEETAQADLVVGTVLIPGARAPRLITREMVKSMRPGTVLVDVAIDQGGCAETSRPTTHDHPVFHQYGVVHYCVTNMPAAVPRTSTYALANATLSYGLAIAGKGIDRAISEDPALRRGVNTYNGKVVHPAVAETFGLECHEM
jgi:alanine dehydrogenase